MSALERVFLLISFMILPICGGFEGGDGEGCELADFSSPRRIAIEGQNSNRLFQFVTFSQQILTATLRVATPRKRPENRLASHCSGRRNPRTREANRAKISRL